MHRYLETGLPRMAIPNTVLPKAALPKTAIPKSALLETATSKIILLRFEVSRYVRAHPDAYRLKLKFRNEWPRGIRENERNQCPFETVSLLDWNVSHADRGSFYRIFTGRMVEIT